MIPRGKILIEKDRIAGYYWELPDGTPQNRCPRAHIHEQPEWWNSVMLTYSAYEKGFLPGTGGIDNQPCLLVPLMATISAAISDEEELERKQADRNRDLVKRGNVRPGQLRGR